MAFKNNVMLEGYLKENTLERTKSDKGVPVIRGAVTVAVNDINSVRAQVYVAATTNEGKENKSFPLWEALLSEQVASIEDILKSDPSASFDVAKEQAARVYVRGSLDEYTVREDKKEVSYVSVRGFAGGIKTDKGKSPFRPRATFEVEGFLEKMVEEVKDDTDTGRILLSLLVPQFDESVARIEFVTGEKSVSDYISSTYSAGETVRLVGDLVNTYVSILKEAPVASFGRAAEPVYETQFTNERQVFGGDEYGRAADDDNAISVQDAKKGLALREEKITRNTEARNAKRDSAEAGSHTGFRGAVPGKKEAPKKSWAFEGGF